jgi:hypothetical protein
MRALRRPLLLMFVIGCAASLLTSGRLTLRIVLPATVYASFVPLCEIVALAAVYGRRKMPFRQLVDRYYQGHTAWMIWLILFGALWAFVPAKTAYGLTFFNSLWRDSAVVILLWSLFVDFRFFRQVLERSRSQATRELAIQRLIAWTTGLAIFVGPGAWQVVASWLRI